VGDQHVGLGHGVANPAHDQSHVVGFVVGRNDHQYASDAGVPLVHPSASRLVTSVEPSSKVATTARRRNLIMIPSTTSPTAPAAMTTSGPTPSQVAIVRPEDRGMVLSMTSAVKNCVASYTFPCRSTKAE